MTIEKYNKLNTKGLDYVIYKGKRYHLTNDTKNNNIMQVVCDGETELYKLVQKYTKKDRQLSKRTSKNYHTLEEVLGINPKHKHITCNYNVCDSIKQMSKENVSLEYIHTKANYKRLLDKHIPHMTSINTVLKHIKKEQENQFTTDTQGNLVKIN